MRILFIETAPFSRDRETYLPDNEFQQFEAHLLTQPESGDLIVGTGGCRKIRWKRQGTGKSSGVRIIYYYISKSSRIYLLLIYPKNQQDNLTAAQKAALKQLIEQME